MKEQHDSRCHEKISNTDFPGELNNRSKNIAEVLNYENKKNGRKQEIKDRERWRKAAEKVTGAESLLTVVMR